VFQKKDDLHLLDEYVDVKLKRDCLYHTCEYFSLQVKVFPSTKNMFHSRKKFTPVELVNVAPKEIFCQICKMRAILY